MGFHVCNPLLLYFWINTLYYATCYDQLVITNRTKVESSSIFKFFWMYAGSADKTIDKYFNQQYTNCMHTAINKSEAWLKIDLGDTFNLKSVKIWYRDDRGSGYTRRLKGFSILASHNSEFHANDTCYQDPGNVTLETVLEMNCSRTARFVKIYTNKKNEEGGPILEICEVEIFGCPRKKYGERCVSCDTCKQDCDITGRCDRFGCLHNGYIPPYCKECQRGFYGRNCSLPCGHCAENATCDQVTGSCPSGYCEPGWKYTSDKRCDQECDDGTFGYYCLKNCSEHCIGGLPCNKIDGVCLGECEDGWIKPQCNETCKEGWYGKNCTQPCGHCAKQATCNHVTGSCPYGLCEPGWKHTRDKRCDQECDDGTFSYNCEKNCSKHCIGELTCNKANGICLGRCADGWMNHQCNETCNPGWYGRGCQEQCGHCDGNKTCHHVNGSCPTLCQPGYQKEKCNEPCSDGWYGRGCKEQCGYCRGNKPCHYVNGSCLGFCEPGYYGQKCEDNLFSQHLANQREMIKLMRESLAYKRRKAQLRENGTSPTGF